MDTYSSLRSPGRAGVQYAMMDYMEMKILVY